MEKRIALVSQGGGTRGAFTAGVQDVLMREGIRFPYIVGTSAGALNNVDYLSGDIGRSKVVTTELVADKKFLSLHNLIHKGGLFDFQYLGVEIPKTKLPFNDKKFDEDPRTFIVAATSLETGRATYFQKGVTPDIWPAIYASASLPLLSKPVEVEGQLYLDGGPTAAVPWRKPVADGVEKLVVILTRPVDYRKKNKRSKALLAAAKSLYHNYPNFLAAYLRYPLSYNKDMDDLLAYAKEGKAFLIAPEESLGVSNHESSKKKLLPVYEKGVERMEELLPELLEFLRNE